MKWSIWIACALALSFVPGSRAELKKVTVESRITAVTLFRSQALTVRTVELPAEKGELGLVIEGLPASIQPNSLFATAEDAHIRSVQFLTEMVAAPLPEDKAAALEKQLQDIRAEQAALKLRQGLLAQKRAYVAQLQKTYLDRIGTQPASGKDEGAGNTAGFDFASIAEMTAFLYKQQEALTKAEIAHAAETRRLTEEQAEVQARLQVLRHRERKTAGNRRVKRKAVVYIARQDAAPSTLKLHYLVNGAGWSPAYNLNMAADHKTLGLEYLAHVRQTTGED